MQPFCSTDYHTSGGGGGGTITGTGGSAGHPSHPHHHPHHHQTAGSNNSGFSTTKSSADIDAAYSYNNWSNGYTNYQYGSCAPPPPASVGQHQYATHPSAPPPPPPPTMVLYPHVYSTVNQNQIHLHLHGTDKLEQYLGSTENALTISSARGGIEIGIGTATDQQSTDVIMGAAGTDSTVVHHVPDDDDIDADNRVDDDQVIVGDPGSVWRPY